MPDKKVENAELREVPFNADPIKDQRYSEYWKLFQDYKNHKNQAIRFFNKDGVTRGIKEYVRDSVDAMNEYHLKPSHKEAWQNNVFDPITRDKLIAVLSRLAAARMKPELLVKPLSIFKTEGLQEKQEVLGDLLDAANYHNMDGSQLIWELYTVLSEGTVIGYESWERGTKEVEFVTEFNSDTGEKVTQKMTIDDWDDVTGQIVPIDEFYPESIWANAHDFNVKRKVKRAFWAREMTLAGFNSLFGKYPNASTVHSAASFANSEGILPWGISSDINPTNVFVMLWFDEQADRHGIWANGVELNWGCLPWNHKRMPFWIGIGEPIHHQLLWGKSLPDKMAGMQNINNAVFNAMLDQLFMALNSPIFVDGINGLDEGFLEPGRIYEIEPGAKIQQSKIGNVDPASFPMLQLIKRSMEESTISAQAQGVATGGRKTKFEVQSLQEGAMNIAALALQMMEDSIRHKYWLRVYNIIQYYSMPSRTKTGKLQFKFIQINDRKLSNGKTGTKMVQIVNSKNEMPSQMDLQNKVSQLEGKPFNAMESKIQPVVITKDWLMNREFDLEIRIVPNSSVRETLMDKKQKDLAFAQSAFGNSLYDQQIVAKTFAAAFDQPAEIVKEAPPAQGNPADLTTAGTGTPPPPTDQAGLSGMPGMKGMAAQASVQPALNNLG